MLLTCAQIQQLQANFSEQPNIKDLVPVLAICQESGIEGVLLGWLTLGGEPLRYKRFWVFPATRKELPTEKLSRLRPLIKHMGGKEKRDLDHAARKLLDELTEHEGRQGPEATNVHQLTPRVATA